MKMILICDCCHKKYYLKKDNESWNEWRGDKDLWERYSHAQIIRKDKTVSQPFKIASFYREKKNIKKEQQIFTLNLCGGGSWPLNTWKEIEQTFILIKRIRQE